MKKTIIIVISTVIILAGSAFFWFWYNRGTDCTEAGEIVISPYEGPESLGRECCPGLDAIWKGCMVDDQFCDKQKCLGKICSDCGNGNCEEWENKCNCPEDCKIADECQDLVDCPQPEYPQMVDCIDGVCTFYQ